MTKLPHLVRCPSCPIAMVGWLIWSWLLDYSINDSLIELKFLCMDKTCAIALVSYILLYMDHQAKVWSRCPGFMGCAGTALGQVGEMPNLPHKILPILPHPIFFISQLSLPHGAVCYKKTPPTSEARPYLLRTFHNFQQFQSNFDEVRRHTQMKKIISVLIIYKSAHHFHLNLAARISFNTEHHGGMGYFMIATFKHNH